MEAISTLSHRLSEAFPESCAIAVSTDGTAALVVGKDAHVPSGGNAIPALRLHTSSESVLLDAILAGSPLPGRILREMVAVKDDSGILSACLAHAGAASRNGVPGRPLAPGETAVRFEDPGTPAAFVRDTLIPFLELTGDCTAGVPFALRGDYSLSTLSATVIFRGLREGKTPSDLRRRIVAGLPEFAAHRIAVAEGPAAAPPVHPALSAIEKTAAEHFVLLYGCAEEAPDAASLLFSLYGRLAAAQYGSPEEFIAENRRMLPHGLTEAVSGVTRALLPEIPLAAVRAKIKASYERLLSEQMDTIASAVEQAAGLWGCRKPRGAMPPLALDACYDTLFRASLIHPFHYAFVPYCFDRLLPQILAR